MANHEDKNSDKRRERAYRIWEEEGRPEGRHLDHWQRAEEQHERTEQETDKSEDLKSNGSGPHDLKRKKPLVPKARDPFVNDLFPGSSARKDYRAPSDDGAAARNLVNSLAGRSQ